MSNTAGVRTITSLMLVVVFLPGVGQAGGSCVVAKKLGDSLAVEWVTGAEETALSATEKAKEKLREQGHQGRYIDVHPQALTELAHAYVVIIKSRYQTVRGRMRTSYGCAFDSESFQTAEVLAVRNLQTYSWGWKPENGYEVVAQFQY